MQPEIGAESEVEGRFGSGGEGGVLGGGGGHIALAGKRWTMCEIVVLVALSLLVGSVVGCDVWLQAGISDREIGKDELYETFWS